MHDAGNAAQLFAALISDNRTAAVYKRTAARGSHLCGGNDLQSHSTYGDYKFPGGGTELGGKGEGMEIAKASSENLAKIEEIYRATTQHMTEQGIFQWDGAYPNVQILREDIEKGQMYAGWLGQEIACIFVLNAESDPQYENGNWRYPELPYGVIHRLCVTPKFQNQGIGSQAVLAVEELFRQDGMQAVRLDTFSQNPFAIKMYERLGYQKTGEAIFRKGLFFLYEKKL